MYYSDNYKQSDIASVKLEEKIAYSKYSKSVRSIKLIWVNVIPFWFINYVQI